MRGANVNSKYLNESGDRSKHQMPSAAGVGTGHILLFLGVLYDFVFNLIRIVEIEPAGGLVISMGMGGEPG